MMVIFDNITIPEKGLLEINIQRTVEIIITAEQARKRVSFWLTDQVSYMMGAEPPDLAIGNQAVWRVPVSISYPQIGKLGNIGTIDVDVQTGELNTTQALQAELEQRGTEIVERLLPDKPRPAQTDSDHQKTPPSENQ
jgi:hypothetical protein